MSNSDNLCFYFPFEEDSGVPVLFARMASEIAKNNPDKNIYIIDYENGAIARNILKIKNLVHLVFTDDVSMTLPENVTLIMQSFVPYHWPEELKPLPDTKLFFWSLHPKNFIPSLLPLPFLKDFTFNNFWAYRSLGFFFPGILKRLADFVKLLLKHNALCFMDQTNFDLTRKFLFMRHFEKDYLPVPAATNINNEKKIYKKEAYINYCWVGRICDFKTYILVYTANKLAEIACKNGIYINYLIVGDGPLMDYATENIKENDFFKVTYKGVLPHAELDNFLLKEVDVVTAMGTSALESAKLGIPTVLLDFSYKKVEGDYVFRQLYETRNYDLGHMITSIDLKQGNSSLQDIVLSIHNDYNKEADHNYEYYLNNHSLNNIAKKFVKLVDQSELSFKMIDPKYFLKPRALRYYYKLTS